jgi:hypothetical protein
VQGGVFVAIVIYAHQNKGRGIGTDNQG